MNQDITFFFGAGAEIVFGLKGGQSFCSALLRNMYKEQCVAMLGEDYSSFALVHPNSTKIFLQTIDQHREEAKKALCGDDYNFCIEYIEDQKKEGDYQKIRKKCKRWYDAIINDEKNEQTAFFLRNAVFYESLDSKFNALRNVSGDKTGDARRVISAYMNVFILMMNDLYDIDNSFDWSFQHVVELLKQGELKYEKVQIDSYYERLRELFSQNSITRKIHIATSNYTSYIQKLTGITPAYLHGRMSWFEDYEKLLIYDAAEDEKTLLFRKGKVFPFIMIPSGVKPVICRKQIEEYHRFIDMLTNSSLLCVVGYHFNSEDNHINSIINEWLLQSNHKMVYFNYDGSSDLGLLPWLQDQKWISIEYNETLDFFASLRNCSILSVEINKDNCHDGFSKFIHSLAAQ